MIAARKLFARTLETPGGLKIQTIHAFCERLLHLFPFEANVPSRFEVPDDLHQADLLQRARREVLAEAIESRGSSVSNYVDAEGRKGSFQLAHRVYRRTGKPCVNCGTEIKRIVITQRGTHFCPKCQR